MKKKIQDRKQDGNTIQNDNFHTHLIKHYDRKIII